MRATQKKRLCWNCEGSVSFELDNCPYCGVYLNRTKEEMGESEEDFSPPYRLVPPQEKEVEPEPEEVISEKNEMVSKNRSISVFFQSFVQMKHILIPLLLLLPGSVLSLFGALLFFFSDNGMFTLQWDGSYWPFYIGIGFPMLLLGWRFLMQIEEKE